MGRVKHDGQDDRARMPGGQECQSKNVRRLKIYVIVLAALTITQAAFTQDSKNVASVFLPGIVSTDSNDFSACFSKDGKSFYFSRTIGKKTVLLVTSHVSGNWSGPVRLPFCREGFAYADPAFSPDGELYFISTMPISSSDTTYDYDIWKTSLDNGQWKDPVNVAALNSPQNEFYISFTVHGDVYFSSSRAGGYGEEDIYMAKFENGNYSAPVNLGGRVNTIHSEYDPFITKNGSVLFFASSGREDTFGKADLYWTENRDEWEEVNHFGSEINTPSRDYCPYVSDDGSFFFSSEGEVNVMSQPILRK